MEITITRIAIAAIRLAALALSACAPCDYDDRYDHYYGTRGNGEYRDRGRYDDLYYRSRDYDQTRPDDRDRY